MALSGVPTTGMFSVNLILPGAAAAEINIFDACGRIVESTSVFCQTEAESIQMNVTESPAGMYIVSVSVEGITETARLIKIN
ncbi:MAG: T9SS type A sorting domain-containing protein [Candidatus Aegiribacteria sp.]|nr:T9SS type A sorting domain-containing protein [Candidatus Aegiribacteria sp.]